MRARLIGLGLLAALGLIIATAVHGRANPADANAAGDVRWGSSVGAASEPMLLADATDTLGGSRKMLGSTYYTGSAPSSDKSQRSDSSAPSFNSGGQMNGMMGQQADSSGAFRQPAVSANNTQSIYPAVTAPGSPANNSSRTTSSDGSDSSGSGSGLKALQQRLSSVRKPTTVGANSGNDLRPPVVELPTSPTAAPSVSSGTPTAPRPAVIGPQNGTFPPPMPDIRVAQLPSPADSPSTEIDRSAIKLSTDASAQPTTVPAGPVVGGPLSTSRRPAAPPTATAPATVPAISGATAPAETNSRDAARSKTAITPPADPVLFARQSPLMGVETTGPRSITVGKESAYSVAITNAGDVAAQDVQISIKIPEWCEVVGTKASTGTAAMPVEQRGEPLVWRLPRLEARSKEQLVLRLIPRASRPFDLAVQWTCSPAASQAMVEVKEPKLTMSLDGPGEVLYGQTKVYRLTISNPGTGDAENVALFLAPVDGGPGAPTRHDVGLIHAGESKPVEVELTARQAGSLTVKAVAVGEGGLRADVAEEILVRRAGLKATATGPELKFAGTPTNYTIAVANPGNAAAENISVAAILPPGAKFLPGGAGQYVESENKVTWNIPSLRAGVEQEFEFRCTLSAPGTNRIQVLATAAGDLSDSTSVATNVEALADLKLEVTDPPGPLAVGDEMVYEVHIRNRGTKAAENVDVATFFSNGIEPISAQGGQHEVSPGQVVFRPIASIPPGAEAVLKIKARADQPGNHVFRAEVNCAAVGAKLASEETTLFYGDGRSPVRSAARSPSGPPTGGSGSTSGR